MISYNPNFIFKDKLVQTQYGSAHVLSINASYWQHVVGKMTKSEMSGCIYGTVYYTKRYALSVDGDKVLCWDKKHFNKSVRLFVKNTPRYIRCYYNANAVYKYVVVFTGMYNKDGGRYRYSIITTNGEHTSGEAVSEHVDRPTSKHLGRSVVFGNLPDVCKKVIFDQYKSIWKLNEAK